MTKIIERKRCWACAGSGQMMGGGMLLKDCDTCDGKGKIEQAVDDVDFLLSKNTEHYQSAKEKIKNLDASMTDEEAEKILDQELAKPAIRPRGRPKLVK